jgi:CRISPR-associated protein Csx17
MPKLRLQGCTPEPLMGYLKALGVLRVLAQDNTNGDPQVRGAWHKGIFLLETRLDKEGLIRFFLEHYHPTPIIAPWAGGSGFFGSDNREAVDAIAKTKVSRLAGFADLIKTIRHFLSGMSIKQKPSPEIKEGLLRHYRRQMPDEFVRWMDTALVLHAVGQTFPPLLGTGGNDGRLDFTQNYMQRLVALGFAQPTLVREAEPWLRQALGGEAASYLLSAAVGQFDPGRAGGPNATTGMEGGSLVNPWDFVLMMEGSIVLAGAAARRFGTNQRDKAAFPFTVRPATVGYASGTDFEESNRRGEIWLPLWDTPTSFSELELVFAEGRAEYNGRQSRDGIDFARAVATLGVDRGLSAFARYGFLKRSGKAYVAAPLGVFPVRERRHADLLRELNGWLEQFRRACAGDAVPTRFKSALRRIDSAVFDYCRYAQGEDDPSWLQNVLAALGAAERELAVGDKHRVYRPLAGLSPAWIHACNDGSVEFRLSLSLAFLRGDPKATGSIRRYLEPVKLERKRWSWTERGGHVVWAGGDIPRNLGAVLTRRLLDAEKAGESPLPLGSRFPASLADVADFLAGRTNDEKLADLLWSLMLIDATKLPRDLEPPRRPRSKPETLPSAYAILKLTLLPFRVKWTAGNDGVLLRRPEPGEEDSGIVVKPEPAILGNLEAGNIQAACDIASRRLRASGLIPLGSYRDDGSRREIVWAINSRSAPRLLAALLFPITAVNSLADMVLRRPTAESLT